MGSAVSVVPDNLPEDIKELYELIERQKAKIIEHDTQVLEEESHKMFKGHNHIIETLTGRSKTQIRKLFTTNPATVKTLDTLAEAGNNYAKFIKQISVAKEELEMEAIRQTGEYDEELLVNIIGTSSVKELQTLNEIFNKERNFTLHDLFGAKCKPESQLFQFIDRILQFTRDESKNVDKELAAKQAEIIHKAGAGRLLGVEEAPIMEILANTSRPQCHAINEIYQDKYNMKLERAINMKFKGNAGKLMVMWAMPQPSAIVNCIHILTSKMIVDKMGIATLLAKYSKDILQLVDRACQEQHNKSLSDLLSKNISGTLHAALKGWIELPSPDKGFERVLELYLDNKLSSGYTIDDIMNEQEMKSKFHFLLDKQANELKMFMIDHRIKFDATDQQILSKSSSSLNITSRKSSVMTPIDKNNGDKSPKIPNDLTINTRKDSLSPKNENSPKDKLNSENSPNKETTISPTSVLDATSTRKSMKKKKFIFPKTEIEKKLHEENCHLIYQLLLPNFEENDSDAIGSYSPDEFWEIVKGMKSLQDCQISLNEIETLQKSVDWEMEGKIYYYEALLELSDYITNNLELNYDNNYSDVNNFIKNVINQMKLQKSLKIEKQKETLLPKLLKKSPSIRVDISDDEEDEDDNKINDLEVSQKHKNDTKKLKVLTKSTRRKLVLYEFIPLYVREYIFDTLSAFDFDCNGVLTADEIESLLQTLNIEQLQVSDFLGDDKKSIDPKDASEVIFKVVDPMFLDETDHWICFIDKNSGAYFWFNTKDESTQWCDYTLPEQTPAGMMTRGASMKLNITYNDNDDEEENATLQRAETMPDSLQSPSQKHALEMSKSTNQLLSQ